MKTVQISFNYDPEILEKAGVDLDSGALNEMRQLMVESISEHLEALRETLRYENPAHAAATRQLALIEAFTQE